MKVSLISCDLVVEDAVGACIISQVRFFCRRGDNVRLYVPHPFNRAPEEVAAVTSVVTLDDLAGAEQEHFRLSDLYIYHCPGGCELMESIRQIERGTVVFYYHQNTPPELWSADAGRKTLTQCAQESDMAYYADFCIATSPFNKQDLVERLDYDPDRIYVLPLVVSSEGLISGDDLKCYEAGLAEIVDRAVIYTLPEIPPEPLVEVEEEVSLGDLLGDIKAHSDVALRDYVVRSKAALVGPFIAWVRRNLTSHLREPYLDLTIERQVVFNQQLAELLKQVGAAMDASAQRQAELEARSQALEVQAETLARRPECPYD